MILTLLQGEELGYGAAAVVLRAAYYTGSLGGAGLTFFALLFGSSLDPTDMERLVAGPPVPPGWASSARRAL